MQYKNHSLPGHRRNKMKKTLDFSKKRYDKIGSRNYKVYVLSNNLYHNINQKIARSSLVP